jgi:flagellar protein FlaJ
MMLFGVKMGKKMVRDTLMTAAAAAAMIIINILYLSDNVTFSTAINVAAIFVFVAPALLVFYGAYQKKRDIEERFPVFLRDFVESMRGGMTMPQAFKSVSENDYGPLTPYVKRIAAQLEWGIPVDKVLLNFSSSIKSKVIGRIVSSVVESHRYGGNLADTFEALSNTSVEVDRLRAERKLFLQSQMITGYIIFFVFLAVIIGLEKFLLPTLTSSSTQIGLTGGLTGTADPSRDIGGAYKEIFRNLIIMQGLFAGLSVGKMAEGSMIAGLKHSIIMIVVGIVVFLIASPSG